MKHIFQKSVILIAVALISIVLFYLGFNYEGSNGVGNKTEVEVEVEVEVENKRKISELCSLHEGVYVIQKGYGNLCDSSGCQPVLFNGVMIKFMKPCEEASA